MSFADLIAKKSGSGECECYDSPEAGLPEPTRPGSLEKFIQKFGHVTEEYKFYNDEITIRFNTEEHVYYRVADLGNLIPLNGVTNTVGIIDKSHMLTPWAAKMAIQKLLRIMPTEMVQGIIRIKPLTFEEFTVIALEAKGAHKEKLDEAGDIGHMAHKCLEDSIKFAMANDPDKIVRQLINIPEDQQAATAASGGLNWMQAHNVRWLETESKIYSREFDYAGTMDGLAMCDSCSDKACCPEEFKDRLSLIDWKSSNHLKIEYLFQTASYKHAKMEEHPELKIIDTWILRLGKNEDEAGKFEPWHMTEDEYAEDFEGFLACLRLTRLVDSVEERMKTRKGTMRAIRKEQRETAKALAKEQEKLKKALEKAAAKKEREEEKVRIKEAAKLKREETKAAKKAGVTPGSVRYKARNEWIVTIPGEQLYSTALMAAEQTFTETGWEPIEGNGGSSGEGQGLISPSALDQSGQIGSTPITSTIPEGTQRGKHDGVWYQILGDTPAMNFTEVQVYTRTGWEAIEVHTTEEQCTSTFKPKENYGPLASTDQSLSLSKSEETTAGPQNQTIAAQETQLEGSTTLTVEPTKPAPLTLKFEGKVFVPPFQIPMEG